MIAIDDLAGRRDDHDAVGVAVKGDARVSAERDHLFAQGLDIERAHAGIDVAAIGRCGHGNYFGSQLTEERGCQMRAGSVRAIEQDLAPSQGRLDGRSRGNGQQVIEVLGIERGVNRHGRSLYGGIAGQNGEQILFEPMFLVVGQLQARVVKHLEAIVFVRIVGRGDHDAGHKVLRAGEVGDARRGDQAREAHLHSLRRQATGDAFRDPWSGFTGVHADQHFGVGAMFPGPFAQRLAKAVDRPRVQGVFSGFAANSIGSKKLLCHVLL